MTAKPRRRLVSEHMNATMTPSREDAVMIQLDGLFERFSSWESLMAGLKMTLKGRKKYAKEAMQFEEAREKNLLDLWRRLRMGQWRPGNYVCFTVREPKERRVDAPHFVDKIVQFSAHDTLQEAYRPIYIRDSYACLPGKGQHAAANQVQKYMRECLAENGQAWINKMDMHHFFYTIDRELLKGVLRKRIKDQRFLFYMDAIIDSSPTGERGLPLGNATSQDFAEIYMNELDQAAKRFWAVKRYVRFRDDIVSVHGARDEAKATQGAAGQFATGRLNLILNENKTKIFPAEQGVNAFGYKIRPLYKLVRDDAIKKAKSSKRAIVRKLAATPPEEAPRVIKKALLSINSRLGHFRHGNCRNLSHRIWGDLPWVTIDSPKYFFGRRPKPQPTKGERHAL